MESTTSRILSPKPLLPNSRFVSNMSLVKEQTELPYCHYDGLATFALCLLAGSPNRLLNPN